MICEQETKIDSIGVKGDIQQNLELGSPWNASSTEKAKGSFMVGRR